MVLTALVLLAGPAFWAKAQDATFESSDGRWCDRTSERKGRGFMFVLYDFELYRLVAHRPEVRLLRITPEPKWHWWTSKAKRSAPQWRVPYVAPFGRPDAAPRPATPAQGAEAERRAEAAYRFWAGPGR